MDTHQVLARVIRLVPDDLSNLPSTFDRVLPQAGRVERVKGVRRRVYGYLGHAKVAA